MSNNTSLTYFDNFEFAVHGICLTSVGLAGLVANIVCLLVLRRPALKCGLQGSVNVLLTSMAAIDLVLLLCSLLLFGLPAITTHLMRQYGQGSGLATEAVNWAHEVLKQLTPWIYAIAMGAQTASVYITVVVTIERWERLEENEQQNLAIMLMVVVMIFVLCNVLAMVANILDMLNFNAAALIKISDLLVTLNSSVNLFIYCGFGRKFWREFKKLFHLPTTGASASRESATILRRYWRSDRAADNDSILMLPTGAAAAAATASAADSIHQAIEMRSASLDHANGMNGRKPRMVEESDNEPVVALVNHRLNSNNDEVPFLSALHSAGPSVICTSAVVEVVVGNEKTNGNSSSKNQPEYD